MLEVTVGPVAHGGFCVARYSGRVVFVRHALPGEQVLARVTEGHEGSRFLRADAVEVLAASSDRVPAPCPYARPGGCGGCDWQHASLQAQRKLKAAVVSEQLRRLAGLAPDVTVEELPGAPGGLGWRTRLQFAVDADGRAGLRRHRSHEVEPLERCLIAHSAVEDLGVEGRRWPGTDRVEVIVSASTGDHAILAGSPDSAAIELVSGEPVIREEVAGRSWRVTGSGFWQVHPAAADTLVAAVLAGLEPRPGESVLDLYCGVGLFAGAVAGGAGRVVGIESDRQAVVDARHNLADLPNVRIEHGRVERVLDRMFHRRRRPSFDLVVLDPPRSGAGRAVVDRVARLGPRGVAYVACDPAALARDLAYFGERGYRLESLRAFDLFPHTHHVECVAVLGPDVSE